MRTRRRKSRRKRLHQDLLCLSRFRGSRSTWHPLRIERFVSLRGCLTAQSARHRPCPGLPESEDVSGRINVAVENQPTLGTYMHADGEGLSDLAPAPAARLTGSTRVYKHDTLASFFRFESECVCELTPCRIVDRFSQPRAAESVDVQVFNGNEIVLSHQGDGDFECKVFACIGHAAVFFGECAAPLPPIRPAALHLGKPALRSLESALAVSQIARVVDNAAITERGEREQAQVQPDLFAGIVARAGRYTVAGEANEPVATPIAAKCNRLYRALNFAGQEQSARADAIEREFSTDQFPPKSPVAHGVEAGAATESREAQRAPGPDAPKESPKPSIEVFEGFFTRRPVECPPLRVARADVRQLIYLVVERNGNATTLPSLDAFFESCIVQLTEHFKLALGITKRGRGEFYLEAKGLSHV